MIKKFIVTTTINPPTKALIKFSRFNDWKLIVVGDLKTPEKEFKSLKNCIYLNPNQQEKISKKLSDQIGWNCIQRRNFGFIYAYKLGAEVVATVDDDNIPYKNWGKNLLVGKKVNVNIYKDKSGFFDPLSVTKYKYLWHRGYPVQLLQKRKPILVGKKNVKCLVQADLWDGDPDIDAICRIGLSPNVKFKKFKPFTSQNLTPFNSQNTFLHRSVLKYYLMFPHVGRMDDIWGSYYLQKKIKNKNFIVFNNASVYQERNNHNLVSDLKNEILGYESTIKFNRENINDYIPQKTKDCIKTYTKLFK